MYQCDRCGSKIKGVPEKVGVITSMHNPAVKLLKDMDLCKGCAGNLERMLEDFVVHCEGGAND